MKRVLMLCYNYPPQGGSGCVRSVAFSRHLPAHGWGPHVLSVANPSRLFYDVTGETAPGVVLGPYTSVGAGAVVTHSFPEGYCVVAGNPARILRRFQ